jgi:hypothetical protein
MVVLVLNSYSKGLYDSTMMKAKEKKLKGDRKADSKDSEKVDAEEDIEQDNEKHSKQTNAKGFKQGNKKHSKQSKAKDSTDSELKVSTDVAVNGSETKKANVFTSIEYTNESLWMFASLYFDEKALNARATRSNYGGLAIASQSSEDPRQLVCKALSSLAPWLPKEVNHPIYLEQLIQWECGWLAENHDDLNTKGPGKKSESITYNEFLDGVCNKKHSHLAHSTAVAAHKLAQILHKDHERWFSIYEKTDITYGTRPTHLMKVGFTRLKELWTLSDKSLLHHILLAPTCPKIRYFYIRAEQYYIYTTDLEEFTTPAELEALKVARAHYEVHKFWVKKDIRGYFTPAWALNVFLPITTFVALLTLLILGVVAAADSLAYGAFAWGVFSYLWGDVADDLTKQPWNLAKQGYIRIRTIDDLAENCHMSKRRLLYGIACGSLRDVPVLSPTDVCWFDGLTSEQGCHIGTRLGMRDLASLGLVGYGYWNGFILGLWDLRPQKKRELVPFVMKKGKVAHVDRKRFFMISETPKHRMPIGQKPDDANKGESCEKLLGLSVRPRALLRFFYSNATEVGADVDLH